eukprot:105705_1
MPFLILLLLIGTSTTQISNAYKRGYSTNRRREDYDFYDMITEHDDKYQQNVHRYPPYYFTKHVFPALFGYNDMMDSYDDSIDDSSSSETKYSDRNQKTAFLLSFFFGPVAVGRFYVGDFMGADFKLALLILCCFLPCFSVKCGYNSMQCLFFIPVAIWWIIDIVLFATNSIHGNDWGWWETSGDGLYPQPW